MQKLTSGDYHKSFNNLPVLQKTLIAELIQDAEFDYFHPSGLSKEVIDSLECFRLMSDFTKTQLVEWAVEKRFPLTPAGVAVWKDIQAVPIPVDASPAASDAGKAGDTGAAVDTANAGGLNIADTIGATAWGEIRLVIRPGDGDKDAGGITFHCGKKCKAYSWKDMGLHSAEALRGALMLLARQGVIDRGKYLNTRRRDFEAKRAREKAAGAQRGQVKKLNTKFLQHFPAAWGNPFFNDDGVTKHYFQKIEI
jgi:hypothetical protein